MKIFEIIDNGFEVGVLLYYEKEKTFIIELKEELDEWTAPLLFSGFVKKGLFTIPRDASLLWVRERVIPSGRQNISAILANHKLKEYDEMKFLEISGGKCSQDNISLRRINAIPEYVAKRTEMHLTEVFTSGDDSLICFFADDTIRKVELKRLSNVCEIDKILKNMQLFETCKVGTGGYYATFNDSIDIPADVLYKEGVLLPLTEEDFVAFLCKNVLDTSQTCELLGCSRQNVSYMVKQGQISPVREDVMGNLYLKGNVLSNKW